MKKINDHSSNNLDSNKDHNSEYFSNHNSEYFSNHNSDHISFSYNTKENLINLMGGLN